LRVKQALALILTLFTASIAIYAYIALGIPSPPSSRPTTINELVCDVLLLTLIMLILALIICLLWDYIWFSSLMSC